MFSGAELNFKEQNSPKKALIWVDAAKVNTQRAGPNLNLVRPAFAPTHFRPEIAPEMRRRGRVARLFGVRRGLTCRSPNYRPSSNL